MNGHTAPFLIVFLLLMSGPVWSQDDISYRTIPVRQKDLPLRLNRPWRFHPGDDAAWAAPGLNDGGWMTSPTQFYTGGSLVRRRLVFPRVGWFRAQISVDSALLGLPLAITLEHDDDTRVEVFIDGRAIRATIATGGSGQPGRFFKPPRVFTLAEPGMHVIAVRFTDSSIAAARKQHRGGFSVTINTAPEAIKAFGNEVTMVISAVVLSFTFFFSFGLLHLILFLYYRSERSNAYFSVFCLSTGSFCLAIFLSLVMGNRAVKAFVDDYTVFMMAAVFVALSAFINHMFGTGRMRYRIAQAMLLATVVTVFLDPVAHHVLPPLMAVVCIEAVVLIVRAIIRSMPGAYIIGGGLLLFAVIIIAFAVLISTGPLFSFALEGISGTLIHCAFVLAIIAIPLSMSVYLARSYAAVSRGLGRQLRKVERLSAAARKHEAEKQRLLEERAEDLEREVGIRTEELRRQRDKSDELLENILPAEVAAELKDKGSAAARLYDDVSVLFTDFADFTQRAETLSPEELVGELNQCFSAFDGIITRHGLEKIKTVGDAYIAVSGLPAANIRHAQAVVAAALEVQAYMAERKRVHPATFGIRLGVHSGPVVAGIVGVKKFAYDIWGDTVNAAARMEQHSEAGRLNISAATYALVKDDFNCTFRGELEAKHKGKMGMYFVEA